MKQTFDEALKSAFPAAAVPTGLADRVAHLPTGKARPRRFFRTALACATGALAIGGIAFLAPRAEAITTLSRIAGAVDALASWHMVTYTPDLNGRMTKSGETWCLNGRVRDERERGAVVRYVASGETVEFRRGDEQALRLPGRNDADQIQKLSGMVAQLQRSVYMQDVSVARGVEVDGRKATRLRASSKTEPVRVTLYADTGTDVPFLATVESRRGNGWDLLRKIEIDTRPFAARQVALDLPKGTPVLDRAELRDAWVRRLSKPLATLRGAFSDVAVRSVWMNGEGDLFVLYTNGMRNFTSARSAIGLLSVADSYGTRYLKADGLQGTMWNTKGDFVDGLVFGGEDVQAAIYVPDRPTARPGRIRLTFGSDMYVVPKGFKPKGDRINMSEMQRVPQVRSECEIAVAPASASLPPWMPFLGINFRNDLALAAEKARTRAQDALGRGEGSEAERQAREYIRITSLQAASSGMSYAMGGHYQLLGEALFAQGRFEEARAAWQQSLDLSPNGFTADAVRQDLSKLPPRP